MGLLKRLVVAIEKIAAQKEDYSNLGCILNDAMRVQVQFQHELQENAQQMRFRIRLKSLKSKRDRGDEMTSNELTEIEIGNDMFEVQEKYK